MAEEIANSQDRREAPEAVAEALAAPAFASRARAGAPVVVAAYDPLRVVHANAAALALFGAPDRAGLTHVLFGSETGRLTRLALGLPAGGAARLERLGPDEGFLSGAVTLGAVTSGAVTWLCRRTGGAPSLLALAALGLRDGSVHAPACIAPAPPPPAAVERAPLPAPVATPAAPVSDPPPAAQAREFDAAPSDLGAFEAELARRHPGLPPARFLWRTDAENIVTEITPPLSEIVGPGCADLVGWDFAAAVAALGLDRDGAFARALRGRSTFSRIDFDWPVENIAAVAPVTLGALPAFDRGQAFAGWRGFGVIQLDAIRAAPMIAPPFRPAPSEPPPPEFAPAPEFSGVVVPLRPFAARPPASDFPAPMSDRASDRAAEAEDFESSREDGDDDPALVHLTPHERNAFREIARRLGGRAGDGFFAAPEPPPAPFAPVDDSRRRPAEEAPAFASAFAESLPVGVAVTRGEATLFANRQLLDWLGHADFVAFEREGGLAGAAKGAWDRIHTGRKKTLLLLPREGAAFAVDAHVTPVLWEGAPAECQTLTRPSAAALQQRLGVLEAGLRQREAEADEILNILETAGDGFLLLNGQGLVLGVNGPAEALIGQGRDDIAGENFTRFLAGESHEPALRAFADVKAGQASGACEVALRTGRGSVRAARLIFGGPGGANGKYCAVLRAAAGAALDGAIEKAERDSQAKSELLSRVSHEIRTPLNAILGFAEVIMEERLGPLGNARYKEYLKDIHASGAHVMSLADDLLDLSRIEAGKLVMDFVAVDANRVVADCVGLMQPQANREKVITRLALAQRLPLILADERSLRQIVLNLLANAVRYNEPGGQVIVSTALGDNGEAVLRIKDTGLGMSESELATALEPFGQVSPERGGTGLGLPLTRALAEANRAGFVIRSRKGEGTLVEVTFPLAPAATDAAPVAGRAG